MNLHPPLRLEHLEARCTPDASAGLPAGTPAPPPLAEYVAAQEMPPDEAPAPFTEAPADVSLQAAYEPAALDWELPPSPDAPAWEVPPAQLDALFSAPQALGGRERVPHGLGGDEGAGQADGVLPPLAPFGGRPEGETPDPHPPGWTFLVNYTRKSIRHEEARRGPLPDHEDIVQQVYLEWRLELGDDGEGLVNLLAGESPEMLALRVTVPRVLGRARYEHNKHRARLELADRVAAPGPAAQDQVDARLDYEYGLDRLSRRDRRIVELRGRGETFEAIGEAVHMPRQHANTAFHAAVARLQQLFSA